MYTKLLVIQGDITQLKVDAIVRSGARHPSISGTRELPALYVMGTEEGYVIETEARYVIDTADPVWTDGNIQAEALLEKAYVDALLLAIHSEATSIAFPNIGTGSSGYPNDTAAQVALKSVYNFLKRSPGKLSEVIFACWDSENYHLYKEMLGGENLILHS
jgi:O-acetyl-ADP-ribose deacetylase (regulator of RNase III)